MKKGQRYQRIQAVGDQEDVVHKPYHDNPDGSERAEESMMDEPDKTVEKVEHPLVNVNPGIGSIPLQRSRSAQSGSHNQGSYTDHPSSSRRGIAKDSSILRMRRNLSPSPTRPRSQSSLPNSRQGSFSDRNQTLVEIEGDLEDTLGGSSSSRGFSNQNVFRSKEDKDSASDASSEDEIVKEGMDAPRGSSPGENAGNLFSHGSSFDLLDDDDEVDLQRYNLDFSSGYDDGGDMDKSHNMYHPRNNGNGTVGKGPWIRLDNQHSPTHAGGSSISNVQSANDFLLYLQAVRRQARQRRAQRLLTMPSERWSEKLQFCFMTYCWDATDVGLLVIAVLLVIWFTGLLWLARVGAKRQETSSNRNRTNESQNGAEYNGNAEFDDYTSEGPSWYLIFQWWWWGLGFLLLIRILGPFAIHNVNNRRRQRRRQRFESDNMQRMQQQQQQSPDIAPNSGIAVDYGNIPSKYEDDPMAGVEIMPTNSKGLAIGCTSETKNKDDDDIGGLEIT